MVEYISPIDSHVHLRWNEYGDVKPSFAELAFRDARAVGLAGIIGEPNTEPALTSWVVIKDYLEKMDEVRGDVYCGVNIAMTPNKDQQTTASFLIATPNNKIHCGKTYYVRSTGSGEIEITDSEDQKEFWNNMGRMSRGRALRGPYKGHLENGGMFGKIGNVKKFDASKPETHSLYQNPEAEVDEFEREFRNAYDGGFRGDFVVAHTSNYKTIDRGDELIEELKPEFKVYYETSFHHMFLNADDDYPIHGNDIKMNPPLRPRGMQKRLLDYVIAGRTHIIGTDHAPHTLEKKRHAERPASGIPAIAFWPKGIELLRKEGIDEEHLEELIFHIPNRIYRMGLKPRLVKVEYLPGLWKPYGMNGFSRVDGTRG